MADRTIPSSTYRLQLHAGFGFREATAIVPYLARLGVSHLYLSPILQAAPGSTHGYDVVDHSTVSADLGGRAALLALADAAHQAGLGIVVDIVPNHMTMPTPEHLNQQLWETLRAGPDSPYAHWFDVDWDHGDGRLGLPILGASLEETLAAGGLTLAEATVGTGGVEPVLRYEDHRFPLARGSDTSDLRRLLSQQHYQLADWHDKAEVLNYRRFFDVDTLVAIRVELDDVFDATHEVLLVLHDLGVIDGFRIDHPDGLADPQGYLERLHERTGGAWVVVEKILGSDEQLPPSWPSDGTTGYDAVRAIQAALVPAVANPLDSRWQAAGGEPSLARVELGAKRLVVASLFQPELARLAASAVAAGAARGEQLERTRVRAALAELLGHVDVYRAYLRPGHPGDPEALARLTELVTRATASRPDLTADLEALHRLLADTATEDAAGRDLVVRFQQVCGPVMAKGVEDTTFYRWHRMVALNEVGGDPLTLDSPSPAALHSWALHQSAHHPYGMTTLSTHDTKRNEDTRARLLAAAENLDGWDGVWAAVRRAAAEHDVDEPTGYFLAQTLLGTWPLDAERLTDYLLKAVRESKEHTTWNDPSEAYEQRVLALARQCLAGPVADTIGAVVAANADATRATTLATKLIQLTLPGVPDSYQGGELAEPALVDPDNRRPVDYARSAAALARLDAAEPHAAMARGLSEEKLWVTSRALRLRRDRPRLFDATATYQPLVGASPHLLGFLRGGRVATVVTRWPGLLARTGWGDATLDLPAGAWRDVLTDAKHDVGDAGIRPADLFAVLPVALLVGADS